jgi:hypothetical protein
MWKFFSFMFNTLPCILSYLYLLVGAYSLIVCVRQIVGKGKMAIGQWIYTFFNCIYIVAFGITRIFFSEIWENIFPILGLMVIFVSCCWSHYDEKRNGRRWWNW